MNFHAFAPERLNAGAAFDQFRAATEILFRRRLQVGDGQALGVESALPALMLLTPEADRQERRQAAS